MVQLTLLPVCYEHAGDWCIYFWMVQSLIYHCIIEAIVTVYSCFATCYFPSFPLYISRLWVLFSTAFSLQITRFRSLTIVEQCVVVAKTLGVWSIYVLPILK